MSSKSEALNRMLTLRPGHREEGDGPGSPKRPMEGSAPVTVRD